MLETLFSAVAHFDTFTPYQKISVIFGFVLL